MPYISPDVIENIKQIDLLSYLETYEPDNLVKISAGVYCTKEHDSLKISNGKWMWWSRGFGGYNALDYLTKVKGFSFLEAVNFLNKSSVTEQSKTHIQANESADIDKKLILPKFSKTADKVIDYLVNQRCIDKEVVNYCVDKGIIKESLPYHNAVFMGLDNQNTPRYAAFRATNNSRILGDCSGSDKAFSFRICEEHNSKIHLFECAIDLLSYASLIKDKGLDFTKFTLISLAGVYQPKKQIEKSKVPVALAEYLKQYPNTDKIYLHFDNDKAGRMAAKALSIILSNNIKVIDNPVPKGKDVNDFLLIQRQFHYNKDYEVSR